MTKRSSDGTWTKVPNDVLKIAPGLPGSAGWVLISIAQCNNFGGRAAAKGYLMDQTGKSESSVRNALVYLERSGLAVRTESGWKLTSASQESTQESTSFSASFSASQEAENAEQDTTPEAPKEVKELKEVKEEKPTTPPTPPKHAVPPPTLQQSRHILVDSYFDTWQKVQAIARDKDFKDQQTTAVCQQVLALIDKHGTRAVNEALDEALRGLADIRRPFAWLPKRLEGREQVQQQTESHHERLARERREREAEIERLIAEINGD